MQQFRPFVALALAAVFISTGRTAPARTEPADTEVLFVGNSFTHGYIILRDHGGIPAIFETIALGKGRSVNTMMTAKGGKSWAFYLAQPEFPALFVETLDWIVLQDFSTRPTRLGNVAAFMADGRRLWDLITDRAPNAGLVLFETWARAPEHEFYAGDTPRFENPAAMYGEVHQSYGELHAALSEGHPGRTVRVAPVGTAFARCLEEYPEIPIYAADLYHADVIGSYLAVLVLYATIFEESPVGAETRFPTFSVPEETAAILQEIAERIVLHPGA